MLAYLAGPYRAKNGRTVEENIATAREYAVKFWAAGIPTICPHLNTAHMEHDGVPDDHFLVGDLEMVRRCDLVVLLPGWEESEGALSEYELADHLDIPTLRADELPGDLTQLIPSTERLRPNQSQAFLDTVMSMYRVHLQKNADYSAANILATGEVGLVTRLWDKVARLLNLVGFRIDVQKGEYVAPLAPKNESIDDTLLDAAVYSVIGLLLRRGKWGH